MVADAAEPRADVEGGARPVTVPSVGALRGARPWWHAGHRVLGNPFTSLGEDWCPRCGPTDANTEAAHAGTTYAFKRWCRRCGRVLKWGVWDNVPLLSDRPLPEAALEWVADPGRDRR